MQLETLTVQDVLWIDLRTWKRARTFHFARLEEATHAQYAYGSSRDVVAQAGRFLGRLLSLKPLDGPMEATALVATIAFLRANGFSVSLSDADGAKWVRDVASGARPASEAVASVAAAAEHGHETDLRSIILGVLADYPATLAALTA